MIIELLSGLLIGLIVGAIHFEGLWRTVERLPQSERPVAVLAASFIVRFALLGVVVALLAIWSPVALLAAATGVVVMRGLLVRRHSRVAK